MSQAAISSALISSDEGFRALLQQALQNRERSIRVTADIGASFAEITAEHLASLREAAPDLVFLDFGSTPEVGIRFARFLADAAPTLRYIATGPPMAPELLLEAMQAGISEYLPRPLTLERLTGALERAERKLGVQAAPGAPKQGTLFSFFSVKGGSGCTTVATNVAVQLHKLTGKKTLLVDLDLELGEVGLFLGIQPRFNFVDLVRNFHRMDSQLLASYIETHESGVHLLSAPPQPDQAGGVTAAQIESVLHFLKQHYAYVVVDTQASFSPATMAAFSQSDRVFLVATVDLPTVRNIKRGLPLIERSAPGGREAVRLVVNRYKPSGPITLEEVGENLGLEPFFTLTNDYETVIGAINAGRPIVLQGGTSQYARQLKELSGTIAGFVGGSTPNGTGLGYRLRNLFRKKERGVNHD
jgi:pilus assembly protein CpaE